MTKFYEIFHAISWNSPACSYLIETEKSCLSKIRGGAYISTDWAEMHFKCSEVNDEVFLLPEFSQLVAASERHSALCDPGPNTTFSNWISKFLA